MSKELTFYILFIMLTVSVGMIFQFMLNRIKILNKKQLEFNRTIHKLHEDLRALSSASINNKQKYIRVPHARQSRSKVLQGNLTLEYKGSKADTRAIFILDKE